LWRSASPALEVLPAGWDYDEEPNLQDAKIAGMFGVTPDRFGEAFDPTGRLSLRNMVVDEWAGLLLDLSQGHKLHVFPDGSRSRQWRFFAPGVDRPHVVIAGGRITHE
jgi:hypothetical protein